MRARAIGGATDQTDVAVSVQMRTSAIARWNDDCGKYLALLTPDPDP
jgi:hypothetical protein